MPAYNKTTQDNETVKYLYALNKAIERIKPGIQDAPSDSSTYGRNNGEWVVVSGGGGSETLQDVITNGSTLTQDNTIDFGAHTLTFTSTNGGDTRFLNFDADGNIVLQPSATTNLSVGKNTIDISTDFGTNINSGGLAINGGLSYIDGNQANGKVLTSDGSGNATWQTPSGGGSSLFPTTGTGTATGDVTGDLGGNLFDVINGQYQFTVNSNENNWRIYDYERDNYPVNIDADNKRIQFNQADDGSYRTVFNGTNGDYPVTVRGTGSSVGGYGLINFGIQTSGSEAGIQLDNTGTGGTSRGIIVTNDASGIGGNKMAFTNAGAARSDMVIDGSGNVGIGTTAPVYNLDVNGTVNSTSMRLNNGSFNANAMSLFNINLDAADFQINSGTNYLTYNSNGLYITGDNAVVGIGTTAPSSNLDVLGNGRFTVTSQADAFTIYDSEIEGNAMNIDADSKIFQIGTSGANYNVGIGTTAPAYKLDVNGATKLGGGVYMAVNEIADADYTVTDADYTLSLSNWTGGHTITLPGGEGRVLVIYNPNRNYINFNKDITDGVGNVLTSGSNTTKSFTLQLIYDNWKVIAVNTSIF